MSDETTRTDGWAAASASGSAPEAANPADPAAGQAAAWETEKPSAFCQDCGRGLTPETRRTVGAGVFCEPCLELRLRERLAGTYPATPAAGAGPAYGGAQPAQPAQPGAYGPGAVPPGTPVIVPGEPTPFLAGLLGLIPGVGAMYNGQFAKGVVHLIIFVILVSLADNVNGIFGLFVAGWVLYQAFEAYHTAVARRDGLPLPNAFGFNDIGERLGFSNSWGHVPGVRTPQGPPPPATPWAPVPPVNPAPPAPGSDWAAASDWAAYAPPAGRDWVGYVPPTAFAASPTPPVTPVPPVPPAAPVGQAQQAGAPWGHAPFVETYTGVGGAPLPPGYAAPPFAPEVAPPQRRWPVGALWLIGLGVLILLANVLPDWRVSGRWWLPVLFAGLALWLFMRRLHSGAGSSPHENSAARIACIVRWPAVLMVLAIIFALHAAYFVVTFGMTCAVLLIVFGALLLVERTLGAGPGYAGAAYTAAPDPARASFTTPGFTAPGPAPAASEPVATDDPAKGGQ